MGNPWDNDPIIGSASQPAGPGRPVIRRAPPTPAPKTTWRPAKPGEAAKYGLPGNVPGQISSEGEFRPLSTPKVEPTSSDKLRNTSLELLKAAGVDLRRGVDPVSDLIKGSTSGRLQHYGAEALGAITGEATPGMENIGKLQTIVSDMTLQLTGGSLGNQISNSDRDFIMQRVGNLADPNVPANQRLAAWMQVKRRMANLTGAVPPPNANSRPKPKSPAQQSGRVIDFNDLP